MCDTCVHTCVGVYNACVDMSVHTRVYMCVYKEPICFLIHISQKATESQRGQAIGPVSHSLCDY